jgi:1,2-dihydroxy-3-keto-5-methylthiopentene dioxygenase
MAVVTIFNEDKTITSAEEIASALANYNIDYERWTPSHPVGDDAPPDEILNAYSREIEDLKRRGGYEMLAKFKREHWHDEDEVRFIIAGRGRFHIHATSGDVLAIEVEAGDLIRVPRGTLHWFNLCSDRRIRTIRLFQDTAGWTPHYTESRVDENFS